MDAIKLIKLSEIDEIIPMIRKLHADTGIDKFISFTGFIAWISLKFPLSNFQIWKVVCEGKTVGYAIAEITQRHFELECTIVDAYTEKNDPEFSDYMFKFITDWAELNGCTLLSCYTHRSKAMQKRFEFEEFGTLLMKRIGGKQ